MVTGPPVIVPRCSQLLGSSLPVANTVASRGIDDLSSTLPPPTLDDGFSSSSVSLRANTGTSPFNHFVGLVRLRPAVDADRAGLDSRRTAAGSFVDGAVSDGVDVERARRPLSAASHSRSWTSVDISDLTRGYGDKPTHNTCRVSWLGASGRWLTRVRTSTRARLRPHLRIAPGAHDGSDVRGRECRARRGRCRTPSPEGEDSSRRRQARSCAGCLCRPESGRPEGDRPGAEMIREASTARSCGGRLAARVRGAASGRPVRRRGDDQPSGRAGRTPRGGRRARCAALRRPARVRAGLVRADARPPTPERLSWALAEQVGSVQGRRASPDGPAPCGGTRR